MASIRHMIIEKIEAGERVDLDDFGIEYVAKSDRDCRACGSRYVRTHGGYGSVCYECGDPWFDGQFVEPSLRKLIEEALELRLLRYAPKEGIDWDQREVNLDLSVTGFTGIEFTYNTEEDEIVDAWKTVDGTNLTPEEFTTHLEERVKEARNG